MSILKKMKKKYYRINKNDWDNIKKQKEKQLELIHWVNLKTYLNIKNL